MYGSAGKGTGPYLAVEFLQLATKTPMTHVPYKGLAPAMADLAAGKNGLIVATASTAIPAIKTGKVRALAVTTAKRTSFLPQVPTMNEAGVPDYEVSTWYSILTPARTPPPVVARLNGALGKIHEIRTRFEVLKRDAEIACLNGVVAGGKEAELRVVLADQLRVLDEEFAFVATCNEGGEFMAPEKIAKLKAIGARTWQRTLSDRIGISWEEGQRMAGSPEAPLPASEYLLADKPYHLIERGTLTEEERYKINDHIVQTIIMLSQLPFPGHLKAVPELAGGHHEKMDGTDYPKRLTRDDMSVQARIMAIADIFEALTASDRPYKKGKMLSEAIKIMSFMKKDQHVDADLFELFLTSGVYKEYAKRFLSAEYIDEVDISVYLKKAA